ncbi:MAG TPA: FKBP-type peptidyl-prolyl cis-trans isomerase [Steroidobacteraceae bacterium]|nr:FKBP-type peptidyl-prolyl cis-trans isomerase [Steroidobacteraceae bacterium]
MERRRPFPTLTGRAVRCLAALVTGTTLLATGTALAADPQATPPAGANAPAASGTAAPAAKKPAGAKSGAAAKNNAASSPKSEGSYAIGVSVGAELRRSGATATDISPERVAAGLRDSLGGKVEMSQQYQQQIMVMLKTVHDKAMAEREKEAGPNHAAAATFLAENAKKKEVVTTASGLQYQVLTQGTGESPKATDTVTVNYKGSLLNGTEFDSSYKRGEPATFPVGGVIPGWTEALQLMKTGGKYQLWIPPKLGYDLQSPPSIPPGSLLVFEVELLSVKPSTPPPVGPHPTPPAPPK